MTPKKYLSGPSCETKLNKTGLEIISRYNKPLLCLEFNKHNKQNVHKINLSKNSTFLRLEITVFAQIARKETLQHHILK